MCFFKAPDINVPNTPTPAPLPPPVDEEKTVGEIQFGGQGEGSDKSGKSQLRIPKKPKEIKRTSTGANYGITKKKQTL